jgi:hypothetical protein
MKKKDLVIARSFFVARLFYGRKKAVFFFPLSLATFLTPKIEKIFSIIFPKTLDKLN